MWNDKMTDLEKEICKKFGAQYGVFTGNGTTAMYLAFRALGLQGKKVLFPAISCTNPVNAAIFAGYQVDFCDIRLDNYTIDTQSLKTMLATGKYGIVVPTHIYGHRYDEKVVKNLCDRYEVVLFEDAAQSFYIGDMDLSVMSFGHTKVCDTPLGGGIILTNNEELTAKIREERNILRESGVPAIELFDEYREKYYKIVGATSNWKERNRRLKALQIDSKDYFIFNLIDNPTINDELKRMDAIVEQREKKVKLYENDLDDRYVDKPAVKDLFRWRYTFLYRGDRNTLLKEARKQGIDISSWYYSLAGIYKNEHLRNADIVEKHVVNLWVDSTHSINQIKKEIIVLNNIMKESFNGIK